MNEKIKIEDGISVPNKPGRKKIYPASELKPGQSFFVKTESKKHITSVRSSSYHQANKLGFKVTTRLFPEGIRVWRLV